MATGKITEKPTVEQVKEEAFFFITQQEVNEEGETVESLRRAKITSIVDALKDAGIAGIDGVEFNKITYNGNF